MRRTISSSICLALALALEADGFTPFKYFGRQALAVPEVSAAEEAIADAKREAGLPPLPDEFGPWHPAWSNNIALCTIMRDENATDVREWLLYHQWLGVDHVYITENDSSAPIRDAIYDFIATGYVTYRVERRPHAQLLVYRQCLKRHRKKHNWIAFIDADEFLAVREKGTSLKALLDTYKHNAGLAVYWIMVGPSGQATRPEAGGVLRHYTQCFPTPHDHFKIVANTFFVQDISRHPHNLMFRGLAAPVDESMNPIAYTYASGDCNAGRTTDGCELVPGHNTKRDELRSVARVALYHYVTRSRADFDVKARRGGGNNVGGKTHHFFDMIERGQKHDPVCTELAEAAEVCCHDDPQEAALRVERAREGREADAFV